MIKSELISKIAATQDSLTLHDVDLAINAIINNLTETLARGDRIEIRGFGSFSLRAREQRVSRNPKTGESVSVPKRHAVHFKPGLKMRVQINVSRLTYKTIRDV